MQTSRFSDNMAHMPMISPQGQQGLTSQHGQYVEPYNNTSYSNTSYNNTSAPYPG